VLPRDEASEGTKPRAKFFHEIVPSGAWNPTRHCEQRKTQKTYFLTQMRETELFCTKMIGRAWRRQISEKILEQSNTTKDIQKKKSHF
jgi:hypothetical protein